MTDKLRAKIGEMRELMAHDCLSNSEGLRVHAAVPQLLDVVEAAAAWERLILDMEAARIEVPFGLAKNIATQLKRQRDALRAFAEGGGE